MNSYAEEVKTIMKAADDSMDTYKEIDIISEGLKKYPNSPDLKVYLSFSLSMVNRMSKDENEKKEAIKKAIQLCTMVSMLGGKKCYAEQEQFAVDSLWNLYWTMSHVFEYMTHSYTINKEYEKAIAFFDAHEKLLSIFDSGCYDFYATDKIIACENKAQVYMKIGNKQKCLEELKRFFALAEQVRAVAQSNDFNIAARNPMYFSNISEEIVEEYMSNIYPEKALGKYDAFFGNDEAYIQFKKSVIQ